MTATPPTHPGNEPDPGDMAVDPSEGTTPAIPDLPDEEAEALGDFA